MIFLVSFVVAGSFVSSILGVSAAQQLVDELHANAMAALSFYGSEADLLRQLANFITQRSF